MLLVAGSLKKKETDVGGRPVAFVPDHNTLIVTADFFQAEDGIRDFHVTGVQTCALPILYAWGSWLLLAVVSPFSRGFTSWLLTANNVIKIGAGLLIGALIGSLVAAQARSGFSEVA